MKNRLFNLIKVIAMWYGIIMMTILALAGVVGAICLFKCMFSYIGG